MGYSKVLSTIYSQKEYYSRVKHFLRDYNMPKWQSLTLSTREIKAFLKLLWKLGIVEKGKLYFWKLLALTLWKYPKKLTVAMTLAVYGFHFRKVAHGI